MESEQVQKTKISDDEVYAGGHDIMPAEGYTSLSIRDDVYKTAEEDAKSEHRSVQNYIKHLILQERHFKLKYQQLKEEERLGTC